MSNSMDRPHDAGNVENLSEAPFARYRQDARRLDDELSAELADISHAFMDGQIDAVEGAERRLAAMGKHRDAARALRELHFPEPIEGDQP